MKQLIVIGILGICAFAAEKKTPLNEAGNDDVEIKATALLDKEAINAAVGAQMPNDIIVVQVRVRPLGEKALSISPDDFQIISHKDGQRSGPFQPTQIAGRATMTISTKN